MIQAGISNKNIGLYDQIPKLEHQLHPETCSPYAPNLAAGGNGFMLKHDI